MDSQLWLRGDNCEQPLARLGSSNRGLPTVAPVHIGDTSRADKLRRRMEAACSLMSCFWGTASAQPPGWNPRWRRKPEAR